MEHTDHAQFKRVAKSPTPTMLEAIGHAKRAVQEMTALPIDSVVRCKSGEGGGWVIVVDVIEAAARMGDNDLLASYEINLDEQAALTQFARLRRYHREDREQG